MFQQGIGDQVVVILDLTFTEDENKNQMLTCFHQNTTERLKHLEERVLLAEDEGKVVLCLLIVTQVFETQSLQEAQQTLIIYGELRS